MVGADKSTWIIFTFYCIILILTLLGYIDGQWLGLSWKSGRFQFKNRIETTRNTFAVNY